MSAVQGNGRGVVVFGDRVLLKVLFWVLFGADNEIHSMLLFGSFWGLCRCNSASSKNQFVLLRPLGCTEDRLVGSLDVQAAIRMMRLVWKW